MIGKNGVEIEKMVKKMGIAHLDKTEVRKVVKAVVELIDLCKAIEKASWDNEMYRYFRGFMNLDPDNKESIHMVFDALKARKIPWLSDVFYMWRNIGLSGLMTQELHNAISDKISKNMTSSRDMGEIFINRSVFDPDDDEVRRVCNEVAKGGATSLSIRVGVGNWGFEDGLIQSK